MKREEIMSRAIKHESQMIEFNKTAEKRKNQKTLKLVTNVCCCVVDNFRTQNCFYSNF